MLDLTWTNDLCVGHPDLDAQHKQLVDTMVSLHRILSGDGTIGQAADMLERLLGEARDHFAAEEALMRVWGYEGFDLHRGMHQRILHEMEAFLHHARQSPETFRSLDVTGFLFRWIINHIRGDDQMYVDCMSGS